MTDASAYISFLFSRPGVLDWDKTSVVFTKRDLVDFLRYFDAHFYSLSSFSLTPNAQSRRSNS